MTLLIGLFTQLDESDQCVQLQAEDLITMAAINVTCFLKAVVPRCNKVGQQVLRKTAFPAAVVSPPSGRLLNGVRTIEEAVSCSSLLPSQGTYGEDDEVTRILLDVVRNPGAGLLQETCQRCCTHLCSELDLQRVASRSTHRYHVIFMAL